MINYSFLTGGGLLLAEGLLATFAFAWVKVDSKEKFPLPIQKLFNENFLPIPVVSQIVNFYPMLGVSAVPVLVITLRNNIMNMLGIEPNPNSKWYT